MSTSGNRYGIHVCTNPGSQRNQRALEERAVALGCLREWIMVPNSDLGQSSSSTTVSSWDDFTLLTAEGPWNMWAPSLAGESFSLHGSLAGWYHLLDRAMVAGPLIADIEGVYDPLVYNGFQEILAHG